MNFQDKTQAMLKKKIRKISQDSFVRNNVIFFAGSMVVAVLNYLYHPILGRMMSVEEFGEVQSLISLFMQLAVFTGIFNMLVINITTNYEDKEERDIVISALRRIALGIIGFLFAFIVLFSSFLQDFFQFESLYPFIALACLLLTGVDFTFRKAFLQGISDFKSVSWSGIIFSSGRLCFAIALVFLGFKSLGAIIGLLIAQGIALVFVFSKTKTKLKFGKWNKDKVMTVIKKEWRYATLIFLATSAVAFLYTADVLMVKHWFSPEEAGLYSGIATIARIIFFATGSVSGVLLSAVKIKNSSAENQKILKKGMCMIFLIVAGGVLVFSVFSKLVITILIGARYVGLAPLLGRLSLLLGLVSVINLLFFYFLALRKSIIFTASLAGPIMISLLSFFNHENLGQIVNNFIIGSIVVLVMLLGGIYKKNNSHK